MPPFVVNEMKILPQKAGKCACTLAFRQILRYNLNPVSYTHLDVYKRQVYRELQARRWHAEDLQPLFAKLGEENTGRTLVAVAALEQVCLLYTSWPGRDCDDLPGLEHQDR